MPTAVVMIINESPHDIRVGHVLLKPRSRMPIGLADPVIIALAPKPKPDADKPANA